MAYTAPTITDFKTLFERDFPLGSTDANVKDADITRALGEVEFQINPAFAATQAQYAMLYLYLGAHNLVINLRNSSQGVSGQYNWLTGAHGVGAVSESFVIPEVIQKNPQLAALSKTTYGAKYLSFIMDKLIGNIFTVCGATYP